ncbi:hypothetical protein [Metasolibacillus sp. FSL K6-0083]|uniref:hypothetical protein n=1 Tax=Metasolibacillus sp. FSL K6-0083 TaxID=2921416 RepID=UPI000791DB4D|nr:hypothetical protein A0U40_15480 [[Bacillus] sp. KCTC 13219]
MKKFISFIGIFIAAYIALQIASGMLLTLLYKPTLDLITAPLSSEVSFGVTGTSYVVTFFLPIIAACLAYGATKLLERKIIF